MCMCKVIALLNFLEQAFEMTLTLRLSISNTWITMWSVPVLSSVCPHQLLRLCDIETLCLDISNSVHQNCATYGVGRQFQFQYLVH
jgi:hypothetical protein